MCTGVCGKGEGGIATYCVRLEVRTEFDVGFGLGVVLWVRLNRWRRDRTDILDHRFVWPVSLLV